MSSEDTSPRLPEYSFWSIDHTADEADQGRTVELRAEVLVVGYDVTGLLEILTRTDEGSDIRVNLDVPQAEALLEWLGDAVAQLRARSDR